MKLTHCKQKNRNRIKMNCKANNLQQTNQQNKRKKYTGWAKVQQWGFRLGNRARGIRQLLRVNPENPRHARSGRRAHSRSGATEPFSPVVAFHQHRTLSSRWQWRKHLRQTAAAGCHPLPHRKDAKREIVFTQPVLVSCLWNTPHSAGNRCFRLPSSGQKNVRTYTEKTLNCLELQSSSALPVGWLANLCHLRCSNRPRGD